MMPSRSRREKMFSTGSSSCRATEPRGALKGLFVFLICLAAVWGCGSAGGGSPRDVPPPDVPLPEAVGLIFNTENAGGPGAGDYGRLYSGTYRAPDGVSIDVWVSIRETDIENDIGTVKRMGVIIQGGTGAPIDDSLLREDRGLHTLWVAINYRGSSLTNITPRWECLPGEKFISCLKEHDTFPKINPRLNAQDANSVISLLADDDAEITVDGNVMKVSEFAPSGTVRSPVNLLTSSFGGVVVSHMLAEENSPELHNVFFEQVTVPHEHPISDGLDNAARMMDILFGACEDSPSCRAAYPNMRVNFREFMDAHHSTAVEIDGEQVYAGGVFDRIVSIIEDNEVGRAIRYVGEIAKAHADGSVAITTGYGPRGYSSELGQLVGEQPRAAYGLPQLDSADWTAFLRRFPDRFFPGITNRTAMVCSFGINPAADPDSLFRYNSVKNEPLPKDSGGTKEVFGYGFLVSYRTFLSVCPQLTEQTGALEFPDASDVDAENVIVFRGGLDIKHYFNPDPEQDEIMAYFSRSPDRRRVITQEFLAQGTGQDRECMQTVRNNFWKAADTTNRNLGDDCEESNDLSASGLSGW